MRGNEILEEVSNLSISPRDLSKENEASNSVNKDSDKSINEITANLLFEIKG